MDDLAMMRLRIKELIDAKVTRRAALLEEVASIDKELEEAQGLLTQWPGAEQSNPKKARAKREKRAVVMTREKVVEFLQAVGPQEKRRIVEHFFGQAADPRCGSMLAMWKKRGLLEQHADGRFAAPAGLKLAAG